MKMNTHDLVILFGGQSRERLVSVATAQNVARLLPQAALWFIDSNGKVFEIEREHLRQHQRPFEQEFVPASTPFAHALANALDSRGMGKTFFLATHGGDSENGEYQRLFEQRQIAFTGSDSQASARAFHKQEAKNVVERAGVRVCPALQRHVNTATEKTIREFYKEHRRIVAKPVADGSSYGLYFLNTELELAEFFAQQAQSATVEYLFEPFIEGIEVTAGIIEHDGRLVALPLVEIRPKANRAFDYAGKYLGAGVDEICPAEIDPKWVGVAQAAALTAHKTLGCFGYSRSDLMIADDGPIFLEINTLPGLTKTSLLPKGLAVYGLTMEDFLAEQIRLARQRAQK